MLSCSTILPGVTLVFAAGLQRDIFSPPSCLLCPCLSVHPLKKKTSDAMQETNPAFLPCTCTNYSGTMPDLDAKFKKYKTIASNVCGTCIEY